MPELPETRQIYCVQWGYKTESFWRHTDPLIVLERKPSLPTCGHRQCNPISIGVRAWQEAVDHYWEARRTWGVRLYLNDPGSKFTIQKKPAPRIIWPTGPNWPFLVLSPLRQQVPKLQLLQEFFWYPQRQSSRRQWKPIPQCWEY